MKCMSDALIGAMETIDEWKAEYGDEDGKDGIDAPITDRSKGQKELPKRRPYPYSVTVGQAF